MKKLCILCVVLMSISACSTSDKKEVENAQQSAEQAASDATKQAEEKAEEAKKEESAASKATCTLEKDERVLEVKKTESEGCELFYTKFGESKSVASSGFGTQYCEEVKDRIESNLDKAGFACK